MRTNMRTDMRTNVLRVDAYGIHTRHILPTLKLHRYRLDTYSSPLTNLNEPRHIQETLGMD